VCSVQERVDDIGHGSVTAKAGNSFLGKIVTGPTSLAEEDLSGA